MYKKICILLLVNLMLFTLMACGEKSGANQVTGSSAGRTEDKDTNIVANAATDGFVLKNENSVDIGEPANKLDPKSVYSNLTYTSEMFYGTYSIHGGREAQEKFGKESQYFTWVKNGEEKEFTKLPFMIKTGINAMHHSVCYIEDYNWMELYYMHRYADGNSYLDSILCAYTVDENKLIITPLDTFEFDKESNRITYAFSDVTWEYNFEFWGRNLTLSTGDSSITLTTGLNAYNTEDYFYVDNYLSPESKSIDGIDYIQFRYSLEDDDSRIYFVMKDGETSHNSIGVLQENGLFTFTLALEEGTKTYQFVYFYGENGGIVLTDGTNTYYYNETYSDRNKTVLNNYITENQTKMLDDMSESKLKEIVKKKDNLMEDLVKAFSDAGIKVIVDEKNGEIAMDSSVLFGGDSSVLTAEGKAFLNKFVNAYTSIVFSEKYEGFVLKTMVEGHVAPVSGGSYESGLPLSEERADNVKDYCVSSETGVDTSKLALNLEAVGYSNSKPVIDETGNIDMAASRRVSFRFIINLEQQ